MLKQIFALTIILIIPICCHAQIYRYVDSQGNYAYTDKPHENATQIKIKQQQSLTWRSIPTPAPSTENSTTTTVTTSTQYEFTITSPTENQYIRGIVGELEQGELEVIAQLNTQLKPGQVIQAYLDNQPHGEPQTALTFKLSGIVRGTHSLELKLIDQKSGQLLTNSNTVKFYMHRNIIRKAPAPPTS